jgi:hypothetical protein
VDCPIACACVCFPAAAALTEFIQGPCSVNQTALVDAKVLTSCATILSWTKRELAAKGFLVETETFRRLRVRGKLPSLLPCSHTTPWLRRKGLHPPVMAVMFWCGVQPLSTPVPSSPPPLLLPLSHPAPPPHPGHHPWVQSATIELLLALLEGSPSMSSLPKAPAASGDPSVSALSANISNTMVTVLDIRGVKKRMGRIYRRFTRAFAQEQAARSGGLCGCGRQRPLSPE